MRILLVLSLLLLTACSASQLTESDGGDLTRSEVEFLSGRLAGAVEAEFPLVQHKLVNRYVTTLGQSMIAHNPDLPPLAYEFRVLKSNEVLVFSLPGGIVYVSLGTLREMALEGQFAAALAHELAHQQAGHQLLTWRRRVNTNRGQRYLLDFSGGWRASFLGENGALHLDEKMEEEADGLAPVVLYRAGFDPRLYGSYLGVLRKLEAADPRRVATLLSLHPPLAERTEWARRGIAQLPPLKEPAVSSATFQQIKAILQEAAKRGSPDAEKL